MYLANKALDVISNLDDLNKTNISFSSKKNKDNTETCMFKDLSLLKQDGEKFMIANPKHISKVNFKTMNIKQGFFDRKLSLLEKIMTKKEDEEGIVRAFCEIELSNNKKIEIGLKKLIIMDDKTCFGLTPYKNRKKILNRFEQKDLYKELNIHSDLLNNLVLQEKEKQERKNDYKNNSTINDLAIESFINKNKIENEKQKKNRTKLRR